MKRDRIALSTDATAQSVANDALGTGNAVDAIVAGVLSAAAMHPSVLLGPLQVIIGGIGMGLRALDGRLRQPGIGVPRPRGFHDGDPIPLAARVAVPMLPQALSSLASTYGSRSFGAAATQAAAACERGAPRKSVLALLGSRGPAGLLDRAFFGAIEQIAGRMEGGTLTRDDLQAAVPTMAEVETTGRGSGRVSATPWDEEPEGLAQARRTLHLVLAADCHGGLAAAVFEVAKSGIEIAELGLIAPLAAEPVMRGQTRKKPGTSLASAAPVRIWGGVTPEGAFGCTDPEQLETLEAFAREPIVPSDPGEGSAKGLVVRYQDGRVAGRSVNL